MTVRWDTMGFGGVREVRPGSVGQFGVGFVVLFSFNGVRVCGESGLGEFGASSSGCVRVWGVDFLRDGNKIDFRVLQQRFGAVTSGARGK